MKLFFDLFLSQDDQSELLENCKMSFTKPVPMSVNVVIVSNRLSKVENVGFKVVKHYRKMPTQKEFKKKAKRFYQLPLFL